MISRRSQRAEGLPGARPVFDSVDYIPVAIGGCAGRDGCGLPPEPTSHVLPAGEPVILACSWTHGRALPITDSAFRSGAGEICTAPSSGRFISMIR